MRAAVAAVLGIGLIVGAGEAATAIPDVGAGDRISFGANSYPPNAVYEVISCGAGSLGDKECRVRRLSPDPEDRIQTVTLRLQAEVIVLGRGGAASAATAAASAGRRPGPNQTPAAGAAVGGACPKTAYGGPISGERKPSEGLFRQKIADSVTMAARDPYWYGVAFDSFSVGAPIRNAVTVQPGVGATRVSNGAPPNATLHPVQTTLRTCEGAPSGSSGWRTRTSRYYCFVSRDNEWTCGAAN